MDESLFNQAVQLLNEGKGISGSYLQRKLKINDSMAIEILNRMNIPLIETRYQKSQIKKRKKIEFQKNWENPS